MKFITSIILTAALAFVLCLQLPWFMIAVSAFIVAFAIPQSAGKAFVAGALGVIILWLLLSVLKLNDGGKQIANHMAKIIPVGGSVMVLVLVTVVVGGLVAGMAALTGSYGRKLFTKNKA
jgi:hypothetical protein